MSRSRENTANRDHGSPGSMRHYSSGWVSDGGVGREARRLDTRKPISSARIVFSPARNCRPRSALK